MTLRACSDCKFWIGVDGAESPTGDWLDRFGPPPGHPGCRVPVHLMLAEASAVAGALA